VFVVGAGLAALPTPGGAISPGPSQIPLIDSANGGSCPQAEYVVVSSGAGASQVLLVVPPGPVGCPPGLDMTVTTGLAGLPPGEALALPLTAASCQAGTDLLNSEITALGQTPGGGISSGPPGGGSSPCASGDAAWAQLQPIVASVPRLLEEFGIYYYFQHDIGKHTLVVAGAPGVPIIVGAFNNATGTPGGVFTLSPADSPSALYALQPSGTVGVATITCSFCPA
jgi:hypothetical protein